MRKAIVFAAALMALSASALTPAYAEGGCYRIGETGYHHYNFCLGPWFLYRQGSATEGADYSRRVAEAPRRRHHHRMTATQ